MGPLLFLVFINDLPEQVQSEVRLFADDAVVYRRIHSEADSKILQEDLDRLLEWERTWQMAFHPEKCQVIRVTRSTKPRITKYHLRGCQLEEVDSARYLGVDIHRQLDWTPHINRVTKSDTRQLNFVRRNIKVSSEKVKTTAYKALVRPSLDYCCTVWDPHHKKTHP